MKNIFSILKDFDIEVKDDQKKDIEKAVNENYKTIAEFNAVKENVDHLNEEIKTRDKDNEELKKKLEAEGDSAEKIKQAQEELEAFKIKYNESEEAHKKEMEQKDYEYAVKQKVDSLKFSSNAGKEMFTRELIEKGLPLDDGELNGFDDFVKKYKQKDAGLFEKEGKAGNYGGKTAGSTSKVTKEEIMKIPDRAERQKAIADHIELFNKTEG